MQILILLLIYHLAQILIFKGLSVILYLEQKTLLSFTFPKSAFYAIDVIQSIFSVSLLHYSQILLLLYSQ